MYSYSFVKWINSTTLTDQLKFYNLEPIKIDTVEEEVYIFYGYQLSEAQEKDLQTAVAAHDPAKPTIPRAVTARQIRMALVKSGYTLSGIESTLDALPEPQKSEAKIAWEYSNEFQRLNPLIAAFAPMLGLTSEQIDQLFVYAATL